MSNGSGKVVCVTGASGYIASWIVKFLLQRGYTVRATVREPALGACRTINNRIVLFRTLRFLDDLEVKRILSRKADLEVDRLCNPRRIYFFTHPTKSHKADLKKTEHLCALSGANERLHLFKADLLEEGSFDAGIEGCDGVFHTASPFNFAVIDPQAEMIEPAVKGTLNVLASCKKFSIKRIVVTSSMAAVVYNARPKTPDVVVDDTWSSSPEVCEQDKQWYVLSKTLAEAAASKFAKENAIDMITMNPTMVIGPLLQPTLNMSCALILNLINGSPTFPNLTFGWVNVKDVAMAHILAFELPSASGRYFLGERVAHFSEIVKIIHGLYPILQLPEKCADDKPFVPIYQVSQQKFKSLGLDYIPVETSIKETIESLKEKNFVSF